ncbi:hypothetical protein GQ44DRAFT_702313 [Phaeosphaeriaceae sp. PMI808]|nr:hypothetical protein GQ44DRAFT_702313 [Phaeosphaeriaceae sp. PMI808]
MSIGLLLPRSQLYQKLISTSLNVPIHTPTTLSQTIIRPTRLRSFHSTRNSKSSHHTTPISPKKPNGTKENPSLPSFSLLKEVRSAHPAVRYTIYAGLGLMATVESTFWIKVLKAKFFPSSSSDEESQKSEEFLASIRGALAGYKAAWMGNYGRYYGGYVWGVGER